MLQQHVVIIGGVLLLPVLAIKLWVRLRLSRAKHPSLRGHSKWSRRIARWIPYFSYDEKRFFVCDGAPESVGEHRRRGFFQLAQALKEKAPQSIEFHSSLESSVSDMRFTNAYRVPFPFRKIVSEYIKLPNLAEETRGVQVRDLDGNWNYDLSGSYGVNVFGYDFYKECMARGSDKVGRLGPVLGPYHPLIRENVERLRAISGLDEVSFHMSGTEAVMQAVRLARYHTGKTHLVRFCGAYHGWWDGVQPGIGNQRNNDDVYTLKDMDEDSIRVLKTRKDIACVLVNPLQALHPNSDAASDATLIASDRSAGFSFEAYGDWLQRLRRICSEHSILLIIDEVFTGFRLAYGGAQEYFGVQGDLVTYGKSLGGGLPVGVVCGRAQVMKRYKEEQPVNISFARGTFNSHPVVMATMNEFLHRIELPWCQKLYRSAEATWNRRVAELNQRLEAAELPVSIVNLGSIWTIVYTQPCRYNWMLQFYLRKNGLLLSWVGSGRVIMSLNYSDDEFAEVCDRFIAAAREMFDDGWWWSTEQLSNRSIKRQMMKEMLQAKLSGLPFFRPGSTATADIDDLSEVHN